MKIIEGVSHTDHHLSLEHKMWLLSQFSDVTEFFIKTIEMPAELPDLPCGLHGPAMGDPPVPESEVRHEARNGRAWTSRLCARPVRPSRLITAIGGPYMGHPCVLYTAYGGPAAPREPGDPALANAAALEEIRAFWAEHALSG